MHALRNRLILIVGLLIVVAGQVLNRFSGKYQGLYRSLQYRNLKLEETVFTMDIKRILMLVIGVCILFVLGRFLMKSRHLLKEKGVAIAGILLFGGQSLNSLGADSSKAMGVYVLFFGYVITLIGFVLALYEVKEQGKDEV